MSASAILQQRRYALAFVLVVAIAALDEFNQSFEASRTSSVWDVMLDISGGLVMIMLLVAIRRPAIASRPIFAITTTACAWC